MRLTILLLICCSIARATPVLTTTFTQDNWYYTLLIEWSGLPENTKRIVVVIDHTNVYGLLSLTAIPTSGHIYYDETLYGPYDPVNLREKVGVHNVYALYNMTDGWDPIEIYGGQYTIVAPVGPKPASYPRVPDSGSTVSLLAVVLASLLAFRRQRVAA